MNCSSFWVFIELLSQGHNILQVVQVNRHGTRYQTPHSLVKVVAVWIGMGPDGFLIADVFIEVQRISTLGIKAKGRVNLVVEAVKGPYMDP